MFEYGFIQNQQQRIRSIEELIQELHQELKTHQRLFDKNQQKVLHQLFLNHHVLLTPHPDLRIANPMVLQDHFSDYPVYLQLLTQTHDYQCFLQQHPLYQTMQRKITGKQHHQGLVFNFQNRQQFDPFVFNQAQCNVLVYDFLDQNPKALNFLSPFIFNFTNQWVQFHDQAIIYPWRNGKVNLQLLKHISFLSYLHPIFQSFYVQDSDDQLCYLHLTPEPLAGTPMLDKTISLMHFFDNSVFFEAMIDQIPIAQATVYYHGSYHQMPLDQALAFLKQHFGYF